MKTLIETIKTGYQAIDKVLVAAQPFMDDLMEIYEKFYTEELNREFTQRDREYSEIAVLTDLIKAFSKYILKTDDIEILNFSTDKGKVTITCYIIRDGQKHHFSTRTIIAGGYIQKIHYRYISDTSLRSLSSSTALDAIKAEKKKMEKVDKLKQEIENYKLRIINIENEIEKRKLVSDEEIISNTRHRKENYQYTGQPNFKDAEAFDNWLLELDKRDVENYREKTNYEIQFVKYLQKELTKIESKLKSLQ